MARNTLARRRHGRFLRDTDPAGGGGNPGGDPGNGNPGGDPGNGGPGGGGGDPGGDKPPTDPSDPNYFPPNTAVAEMNDKQQAAYWRNQSKVQQRIADARKDYDQQSADAKRWREYQQSQQSPSEQAIAEAREAGRAEAARAVNEEQVQNLLRVALGARGKSGDDLDELVAAANPTAFITDGKVSADKVTNYAAKLAGAGNSGGGGGGGGLPGQGKVGGGSKPSVTSGRDLFAERRGGRKAAANT